MTKRFLAIIAVSALAGPAIWGDLAIGSIRAPASLESPSPQTPAKAQKKPSLVSRLKSSLARFRPVAKENAYLNQDSLADHRTIDEVYDEEMSERMEGRYKETVAPLEQNAVSPYRRASFWETERYEKSRKDLANWTLKEVGKDQLKDFERRARRNSGTFAAVASVAASDLKIDSSKKEENSRAMTEEERIARAHQMDLPAQEEEPSIPTRLKAKLNVIKARGQLTFSNPVVVTSVEGGAGSGENLAVEMNRDFRSIDLYSKVRYGVDESVFNFVVNQKITDEVSVDLNSQRWTGSKRGASGEKKRETAKVVYSISF